MGSWPPALNVRATGANGARPPAEPLHPVLPNATENPAYNGFNHTHRQDFRPGRSDRL